MKTRRRPPNLVMLDWMSSGMSKPTALVLALAVGVLTSPQVSVRFCSCQYSLANSDHLAAFDDILRDRCALPLNRSSFRRLPSVLLRFPPRRGVVPGG
jgi:hypothetical protein